MSWFHGLSLYSIKGCRWSCLFAESWVVRSCRQIRLCLLRADDDELASFVIVRLGLCTIEKRDLLFSSYPVQNRVIRDTASLLILCLNPLVPLEIAATSSWSFRYVTHVHWIDYIVEWESSLKLEYTLSKRRSQVIFNQSLWGNFFQVCKDEVARL